MWLISKSVLNAGKKANKKPADNSDPGGGEYLTTNQAGFMCILRIDVHKLRTNSNKGRLLLASVCGINRYKKADLWSRFHLDIFSSRPWKQRNHTRLWVLGQSKIKRNQEEKRIKPWRDWRIARTQTIYSITKPGEKKSLPGQLKQLPTPRLKALPKKAALKMPYLWVILHNVGLRWISCKSFGIISQQKKEVYN